MVQLSTGLEVRLNHSARSSRTTLPSFQRHNVTTSQHNMYYQTQALRFVPSRGSGYWRHRQASFGRPLLSRSLRPERISPQLLEFETY